MSALETVTVFVTVAGAGPVAVPVSVTVRLSPGARAVNVCPGATVGFPETPAAYCGELPGVSV
jgi:hypothetical protein